MSLLPDGNIGRIRVVKPTSLGRELLLYRVMRGDNCILTVSCLLGDCSYQARGIVEADLAGVSISRQVFLQLVEQSPEFRINIFHFFGERVTRLMESHRCRGLPPAGSTAGSAAVAAWPGDCRNASEPGR